MDKKEKQQILLLKAKMHLPKSDPGTVHYAHIHIEATDELLTILHEEPDDRKRMEHFANIETFIAADLADLNFGFEKALGASQEKLEEDISECIFEINYFLSEDEVIVPVVNTEVLLNFIKSKPYCTKAEEIKIKYLSEILSGFSNTQYEIMDILNDCLTKETKQRITQ